ncbi:MAG: DUF971 domain-containing protein [Actinomycetota bacterium]
MPAQDRRRDDIESVEVVRTSHVEVRFEDGLHARYELPDLRLACPCADCNARRLRGQPVAPSLDSGGEITVATATLTGAWGLNLDWSDGHTTGIYAWATLRDWVDDGVVGMPVADDDTR